MTNAKKCCASSLYCSVDINADLDSAHPEEKLEPTYFNFWFWEGHFLHWPLVRISRTFLNKWQWPVLQVRMDTLWHDIKVQDGPTCFINTWIELLNSKNRFFNWKLTFSSKNRLFGKMTKNSTFDFKTEK